MIHDSAVIHDGCSVGADCCVWQYSSLLRGARIGTGSSIGAGAIVDGAVIGQRCAIGAYAQIHPGIIICNDVFVGPGAIFCNDVWPRVSKEGFDGAALFDRKRFISIVEDGASIGAGAIVLPGAHIGYGAMVAAGAVVLGNVPDRHLYHRGGEILPLPEDGGRSRRMRFAE